MKRRVQALAPMTVTSSAGEKVEATPLVELYIHKGRGANSLVSYQRQCQNEPAELFSAQYDFELPATQLSAEISHSIRATLRGRGYTNGDYVESAQDRVWYQMPPGCEMKATCVGTWAISDIHFEKQENGTVVGKETSIESIDDNIIPLGGHERLAFGAAYDPFSDMLHKGLFAGRDEANFAEFLVRYLDPPVFPQNMTEHRYMSYLETLLGAPYPGADDVVTPLSYMISTLNRGFNVLGYSKETPESTAVEEIILGNSETTFPHPMAFMSYDDISFETYNIPENSLFFQIRADAGFFSSRAGEQ